MREIFVLYALLMLIFGHRWPISVGGGCGGQSIGGKKTVFSMVHFLCYTRFSTRCPSARFLCRVSFSRSFVFLQLICVALEASSCLQRSCAQESYYCQYDQY